MPVLTPRHISKPLPQGALVWLQRQWDRHSHTVLFQMTNRGRTTLTAPQLFAAINHRRERCVINAYWFTVHAAPGVAPLLSILRDCILHEEMSHCLNKGGGVGGVLITPKAKVIPKGTYCSPRLLHLNVH